MKKHSTALASSIGVRYLESGEVEGILVLQNGQELTVICGCNLQLQEKVKSSSGLSSVAMWRLNENEVALQAIYSERTLKTVVFSAIGQDECWAPERSLDS